MTKPFSAACERNVEPIYEVLKNYINSEEDLSLFEVGSGTGQHASYLAPRFPRMTWMPSDNPNRHSDIDAWTKGIRNVLAPQAYTAGESASIPQTDLYFTANTLHIMSWNNALSLFEDLGEAMLPGALLFVYGPFNINKDYTSNSNRVFDHNLKQRDPNSGIRDKEKVEKALGKYDINLLKTHSMPANNFLLVFKREA